tara:strand:- start:26 stop:166 length:141 start_codon:yes stop_codon:yes gene_type:complete
MFFPSLSKNGLISFDRNAIKHIKIKGTTGNMSLENSLNVANDKKRP